jgi:hypothetical protein
MGKTKHEAIERAEKLVEQRRKGLHTDEAKSSLADFLKRFLEF